MSQRDCKSPRLRCTALISLLTLFAVSAAGQVDPLPVGEKDFRISWMGPSGSSDYAGLFPEGAYRPASDEFVVVFAADHHEGGLVDGELEIYAQRLNAATGAAVGPRIRVSSMGGTGDDDFIGVAPTVAYDSMHDEYLVVWIGNEPGFASSELEVFARRLRGSDATPLAAAQRISAMGGGIGDATYTVISAPRVAYASNEGDLLVVWAGVHTGLAADETEIFMQRIEGGTGAEIGGDLRISDLGGTGDASYKAQRPHVAYSDSQNEYWVVFSGGDDSQGQLADEHEVFLQRIDATNGQEIGFNDQRISTQGGLGNADFDASFPSTAISDADGVALVVWQGDTDAGGTVDDEFEVYVQRLDLANGLELGDDVRISDLQGLGTADPDLVLFPRVLALEDRSSFLVVWNGQDEGLVHLAETYSQLVDTTGAEIGTNDARLTLVGNPTDPEEGSSLPVPVAGAERILVVFMEAERYRGGPEVEVAGQLLEFPVFADGYETGDTSRWSSALP